MLAKGLGEQHNSHIRLDHSKLADKQPGNGEMGGAMDRLLLQQSTDTSASTGTTGLAAATMTSSATETTSDLETPGVSGIVCVPKHAITYFCQTFKFCKKHGINFLVNFSHFSSYKLEPSS